MLEVVRKATPRPVKIRKRKVPLYHSDTTKQSPFHVLHKQSCLDNNWI